MLTRRHFLRLTPSALAALVSGSGLGCKRSASVTIGSKNFQEQWILAALIAEFLRTQAATPAGTKDLAGTLLCHTAIRSGDIDCYVEYTGTALASVLKHKVNHDVNQVYKHVRREYKRQFSLLWLPPLGFENTFVLLVRKKDADRHNLQTISDLRRVTDHFRPGFGFEFYDRPDGYKGLINAYGLSFAKTPKQMKLGLTYQALATRQIDVIAGNSTDGLIQHLNLQVLTDDKRFFPPYQAAPVLRATSAKRFPDLVKHLSRLGGAIDAAAMRRANYAVDHNRIHPTQAAKTLLATLKL